MALIAIDARKWSDFGIGSYLRGLVPELVRQGDHRFLLVGRSDELSELAAAARDATARETGVCTAALDLPPYSLPGLVQLARLARTHRADLLHIPHYTLPPGRIVPAVVTVHDTIHLAMPGSAWKGLYARAMLGHAVRGARRVIVPSETVRRDIGARWPHAAERTRVIPNGLPAAFMEDSGDGRGPALPNDYVLFVGNERPYKNLLRVLEAFALLVRDAPYAGSLVLAGIPLPPRRSLVERCRDLGILERVHLTGYLPDASMPHLYRGARLLLAPSLAEGFGLPVLEALATGTPVVTSRGGAQEEVADGAALLVNPGDAGEIAAAARRLLGEAALVHDLVKSGHERARHFRWERAARATLDVYGEALGEVHS